MAVELFDTSFRPEGQTHELHTKESDVWAFGMVVYVSVASSNHLIGSMLSILIAFLQSGNAQRKRPFCTYNLRYGGDACDYEGRNSKASA